MLSPPQLTFESQTNLYETWYVYHGTSAHLKGVLYKYPLPIILCVCVSPIVATQLLGKNPPIVARQGLDKNVIAATKTCNNRRIVEPVVLHAVIVLSRKTD
jgi:hypothetical protein